MSEIIYTRLVMRSTMFLLFLILCLLTEVSKAQNHFAVKGYSFGYRISEIESFGNNPTTLSPLLKNSASYNEFIAGFRYNGLGGSPGPATMHTFYLNAELYKPHTNGFWKHILLRTGLFVTNNISKSNGSLENFGDADTFLYNYSYKLQRNLQFTGANLGISRVLSLGKRLQATAGIEVQGGIAVKHNYEQRIDSFKQSLNSNWQYRSSTQLSTLKAKNYFQWQFAVPLALQYELWKNKWMVRAEVAPAIIGNRFISKYFYAREAHAAGLWLIYLL